MKNDRKVDLGKVLEVIKARDKSSVVIWKKMETQYSNLKRRAVT